MRMKIKAAILALIFVGSATVAMAQRDGRDAADRGTRLDSDALRNDISQQRLKVPQHPLWGTPAPEPAPVNPPTNKRKRTEKKN